MDVEGLKPNEREGGTCVFFFKTGVKLLRALLRLILPVAAHHMTFVKL